MKLPHFNDAQSRWKNGSASALDKFIYQQQPAGPSVKDFRIDLQRAIDDIEWQLQLIEATRKQDVADLSFDKGFWFGVTLASCTCALIAGAVYLWGCC